MGQIFPFYRKWPKERYKGGDGVLIGSDSVQEWLLPWWYRNYIKYNRYPITWIDLGLSEEMRNWCKERGELVVLRVADVFVAPQEQILPEHYALWEDRFGVAFWNCRNAWFKKPAAFLQTPFERTIWIDSDCEIRGPIAPIFDFCNPPIPIAMRSTPHLSATGAKIYNSGIVPYRWGLPYMEKWVDLAFEANDTYMGDQDILSEIIFQENHPIRELPDIYHRFRNESDQDAIIVHWAGSNGKRMIEHQLIKERLEKTF